MWRMFKHTESSVPDRVPIYKPSPNSTLTNHAVRAIVLAMVAPMERVVIHFGWKAPGSSENFEKKLDKLNNELFH